MVRRPRLLVAQKIFEEKTMKVREEERNVSVPCVLRTRMTKKILIELTNIIFA